MTMNIATDKTLTQDNSGGLIVATDVGGTCTDTVIVQGGKSVFVGKTLSTPPKFADGVLKSIAVAADAMNSTLKEVMKEARLFMHGSTVVDNTLVERKGAITGLLTTEGFEDTLLVTRGAYGRWSGLSEAGLKHPVATDRPQPLVPLARTRGIPERIDCFGSTVVALDEDAVRRAVLDLLQNHNIEALAVCLLWSFQNPQHELRLREIIAELAPQQYVSLSSEIAPVPGEYERTSTTVINAYAGKVVRDYIEDLQSQLTGNGYHGPLLVMQGYGGLLPAEEAATRAVSMLECGPVAGVIGSKALGSIMDDQNIIAADMGGTTFKVGVIQDGLLEYAREPLIDRYHYTVPKIDVVSIGAGGGSIIGIESGTGVPTVGPESAGAVPGPICYDLGGTRPTLTDVFLLIGYIDPTRFLSGSMKLNTEKTKQLFAEQIAKPLSMSVEEAAIGIFRIAASQSADLIHKITVEQGLDPRDFTLHAFGGSCPMLASMFARELNVKRIVVPYTAAVNGAFGLASADVVHEYTHVQLLTPQVDPAVITELFAGMEARARKALHNEGFTDDKIVMEWSIDMRYSMQVHEVKTPVRTKRPLDAASIEQIVLDFESLYEGKYGKGSAYRGAGIEMTRLRLTARGLIARPDFDQSELADEDATAAKIGERKVFVHGSGGFADATIYDFDKLHPGNMIAGPAVIHTPITTVVIQDQQNGRMDIYRNIIIGIHDAS